MKKMNIESMQPGRSNSAAIAAIVALMIIALACIGASIATVILVLDAVPFHHIFPH